MRDPFGGGGEAVLDHVLTKARDNVHEWTREYQAKMEKWASENGYSPLLANDALKLVDELKNRSVKSFEGLGIKVVL